MARLIEIDWPQWARSRPGRSLPPPICSSLWMHFAPSCESRGLTYALIYADREHFANLAYLTNFDPRFEEALLIVSHEYTRDFCSPETSAGRTFRSAKQFQPRSG